MNYATLILNDDYKYASKINKYIHKNKGRSIAIILGNYELNGCPLFNNKDTRINKLIKIGYDLILEIPSLVYLSDINNLSDYIINLIKKLDIVKLYLPSEFYSLKSFKEFHGKFTFYYPSYDKVFHYYLEQFDYNESKSLTRDYIAKFYQSRLYDFVNLNLIKKLKKNNVKFKLIQSKYFITKNDDINNKYFDLIKLFFTLNRADKIIENKHLDINTINMIQNKIYKLSKFNELENLSAPKNFQYSSFFRSIILSMIDYDKNTNLDIENSIIKCVGLNEIGSKIIREFKKNKKEIATQFVSSINPSISLIEKYQMKLELIYSYLCNKYNSNSDLFKYPVKIEQK